MYSKLNYQSSMLYLKSAILIHVEGADGSGNRDYKKLEVPGMASHRAMTFQIENVVWVRFNRNESSKSSLLRRRGHRPISDIRGRLPGPRKRAEK